QPAVIGIIGLGAMGLAYSQALRAAGFDVAGFDLDPAASATLDAIGGTACAAPSEVADQSAVILLALPSPAALDTATAGPDGIATALLPGTVVCDLSGLAPESMRRAVAVLDTAGGTLLNCTITGTEDQAATGDIEMLVRGDEAAVNQVRPVLAALSRQHKHLGPLLAA
ncbi:NAD(P)-dependent oxidoreductase, partial [Pseudoruegeria sp. SK021]|uniref:NAD(P)-dependent oxidoreductase n=1 Tax=Pseudoruegeria sp. SK021 TaxID=1933035 RepID=UPI000A2629B6